MARRHLRATPARAVLRQGQASGSNGVLDQSSRRAGRDATAQRGTKVQFLGRDEELERLHAAHDSIESGAGSVVEIIGGPGTGKTRLVSEFLATLDQPSVIRITSEPYQASDRSRGSPRPALDARHRPGGRSIDRRRPLANSRRRDRSGIRSVPAAARVADRRRGPDDAGDGTVGPGISDAPARGSRPPYPRRSPGRSDRHRLSRTLDQWTTWSAGLVGAQGPADVDAALGSSRSTNKRPSQPPAGGTASGRPRSNSVSAAEGVLVDIAHELCERHPFPEGEMLELIARTSGIRLYPVPS